MMRWRRGHATVPATTVVLCEAKARARQPATADLVHHERRLRRRFGELTAGGRTYWLAAREVLAERGVTTPEVGRG
jgi:hypothetical protein